MGRHIVKRIIFFVITLVAITAIVFFIFSLTPGDPSDMILAKPVIYLHPEEATEVSVKIQCEGELTVTYPEYGDGWNVLAQPDGTLTNLDDGREYSYLFWEAQSEVEYDFSEGFCVRGADTADFLRDTLSVLGLTAREYNEFIVYWLPLMQGNKYNLISFQGEAYESAAKLEITPAPDSILRVFMAWKPLDEPMSIQPQELDCFVREGFSVVEWGGSMVSD